MSLNSLGKFYYLSNTNFVFALLNKYWVRQKNTVYATHYFTIKMNENIFKKIKLIHYI